MKLKAVRLSLAAVLTAYAFDIAPSARIRRFDNGPDAADASSSKPRRGKNGERSPRQSTGGATNEQSSNVY